MTVTQTPIAEKKKVVKQRPGIPHETLNYIIEQVGGTIKPLPVGREVWVEATIAGVKTVAENNTLLLIALLKKITDQNHE